MTLDIIGIAAADYDFEAIDEGGQDKALAQAYRNLLADVFFQRSDTDLIVAYILGVVPEFVSTALKRVPTKGFTRIRHLMTVVTDVAQKVLEKQTALYMDGKKGSRDIMSVLVRANLSENLKTKLTNQEVIEQLITFFFAGHEPASSTLTWALYELARHPEYQAKLREEIKTTRARVVVERGDGEITISDLDSMLHLQALIKETLRFHTIIPGVVRAANRDSIIPLTHPITLTTGEVVTNLPIERDQDMFISFIAYNRLPSVWGEDADVWRPERFLENNEQRQLSIGVISNVATFSSGVRTCIGWRFAVLEMESILVELLDNFEFSPPPNNIEIIRAPSGVMTPMIKGSKSRRIELPLTVTPLQLRAE